MWSVVIVPDVIFPPEIVVVPLLIVDTIVEALKTSDLICLASIVPSTIILPIDFLTTLGFLILKSVPLLSLNPIATYLTFVSIDVSFNETSYCFQVLPVSVIATLLSLRYFLFAS